MRSSSKSSPISSSKATWAPASPSSVADELKASCKAKRINDGEAVRLELKSILGCYGKEIRIRPEAGRLSIFLVLGVVNGVGKTTTCAKLADYYRREGLASGIILAAGDTFRAAAIDQLKIHGQRLGLRVVAQNPGSDPGRSALGRSGRRSRG